MIKVLLALLMICKTYGLVAACFALRVFYRKQTITYNEHSNKRSNQKVQLNNSGLQKESNQTEQRNSNYERNKNHLLIWTKVKFYSTKIMFKLFKQKEGFETKI